jgi:hypothetical protein
MLRGPRSAPGVRALGLGEEALRKRGTALQRAFHPVDLEQVDAQSHSRATLSGLAPPAASRL